MKVNAEALAKVNALLEQSVPSVGLIFGLVRVLREQFRRRSAGEAEMTFAEQIDVIHNTGVSIEAKADQWFADNPQYDPETGDKR